MKKPRKPTKPKKNRFNSIYLRDRNFTLDSFKEFLITDIQKILPSSHKEEIREENITFNFSLYSYRSNSLSYTYTYVVEKIRIMKSF